MRNQSVTRFLSKLKIASYLILFAVLLIVFWKACNRAERHYSAKCHKERQLAFKGVITNYQTDVLAEKSTFNLNDTIAVTIPRSAKEMFLNNYDTIIKLSDSNLYIVKRTILWADQINKKVDTFRFDCPS